MFNQKHYVPILKGKQGELNALENTTAPTRKGLTPLLEIPPISPKYIEGEREPVPAKSIEAHVIAVGKKFAEALGTDWPVFVDGFYIEEEADLPDGSEPITGIFSALRGKGVQFIPVTGLDRVEEYGDSVKSALQEDKRGVCVRLWDNDLESEDLTSEVGALLKFLNVNPADADLVLDFGPNVPSRTALPYQINALPFLNNWRSLTVASSAFPMDLRDIAQNTVAELERKEWTSWTFLRAKKIANRVPTFGDYAINHPQISEVDPRLMAMSPNIRYTGDLTYVVAKGAAYPRKKDKKSKIGLAASEQYSKLASKIMAHGSWAGKDFSWGDEFIEACSRQQCVGSTTDWRAVGTCHHIAFVVRQIASLP